MEVDWDLHAVVRGCNSSVNTAVTTSKTTAAAASTTITSFKEDADATQIQSWLSVSPFSSSGHSFTLADPFEARNAIEELHELYKPFFPKSPQPPISPRTTSIITSQPISASISSITSSPSKDQTQQPKQTHASSVTSSTTSRKRRKNQFKRICNVPEEGLSSDVWAWRKYGQKPIKGSPYPRGYYRCSSSKGCLARKQVERNRSDPGMFIVTYTAEHNHPAPTHRNSLAGSTRQKPLTHQTGTDSREVDMLEDVDDDEEEEEELAISDIGISDDFFVGLEGLGSEESLPDHFPASFGLPWAANNAATAAGGI